MKSHARCRPVPRITAGIIAARCRRALLLTVFLGAAALPLGGHAAEDIPSEAATTANLADLQHEVAQLKSECGLRREVANLRQELEIIKSSKPSSWQVEIAPWLTVAVLGFVYGMAWLWVNRGRDRSRQEDVIAERTKLQLELLRRALTEGKPVPMGALMDKLDLLLKAVAKQADRPPIGPNESSGA